MSHDTHHTDHNVHGGHEGEKKSKTGMNAAIWFVLILAGLYIAAINFVKVEKDVKTEGYKAEAGKTEQESKGAPALNTEEKGGQVHEVKGDHENGQPTEEGTPTTDTAKH